MNVKCSDERLNRLETRLREFFASGQTKQARKIAAAVFLNPDGSVRAGQERVDVVRCIRTWIQKNCIEQSTSSLPGLAGTAPSLVTNGLSATSPFAAQTTTRVTRLVQLPKIQQLCNMIADRVVDLGGVDILSYGWKLHVDQDPIGMQLVASIMQRAAVSLERTMKFWSVLRRDLQAFLQVHEPAAAQDEGAMLTTAKPLIFEMLFDVAPKPVGERWPEKGLLINLIENSLNSRPDVDEMLTSLLELIFYFKEGEQMSFYWQDAIEQELVAAGKTINDITINPFDPQQPVLTLYGKHAEQVERLVQKNQGRVKDLLLQVQDFNEWLKHARKQVEACYRAKCCEIRDNYSVPVLTAGQDFIEITLPVLQVCGVRKVAFYPEGMSWPDVSLKITCQKEAGTMCVFDAKLIDFGLEVADYVFYNHFQIPEEYLKTILTYIVVDAYYIIAVLDENVSRDKVCAKRCVDIPHDGPKRIKPIRGRFVNLPEGSKHSEKAIATAMSELNLGRSNVLDMWPPHKTYRRTYDMSIYTDRRQVTEPQPVMQVTDTSFRKAFTAKK